MMKPVLGVPLKYTLTRTKNRVKKLILSDHLVTVTEMKAADVLVRCQIHEFIHKLDFQKICAGLVQNMLIKDHLMKRRVFALQFFTLYHHDP